MTTWHPGDPLVGYLSFIFQEGDPRSIQEQANDRYSHGGGWRNFDGFTLAQNPNNGKYQLTYPDDDPLEEIAHAGFRGDWLVLFRHGWVAYVLSDGNTLDSVSRMD